MNILILAAAVAFGVLVVLPVIVASFLRNVEAGTIRLVSWLAGGTVIYRGPGKSKEIPLLTTGTTISSKVINVDLDITDQTADLDAGGTPQPIKVRVLASAIVSVGDTDVLIKTAANRFFAKPEADQVNTLTDLLSSSARRAINLLTHDQLFSARSAPRVLPAGTSPVTAVVAVPIRALTTTDGATEAIEDEDDPLAVIIRKACSRELTDLGLIFNSLNIKQAIGAGGESSFRYRQIEMLPVIAPKIAEALAESRMITVSGGEGGGAANQTTNQIASVIQTVLAAQLVAKSGVLGPDDKK